MEIPSSRSGLPRRSRSRLVRGAAHLWSLLRRPMRCFRLADHLRGRWVYHWNRWRLKAAGVTFGKGLVLEGSVGVTCGARVTLGDHVRLGNGVYLGAFQEGRLTIGNNSYLGRGSTILACQRVAIGDDCLLAPYTYITDLNHGFAAGELIRVQTYKSEPVVVGNDVWFGTGVKVMPGVRIGDGVVVGAGAVVTRDLASQAIAVGMPAREIRKRS